MALSHVALTTSASGDQSTELISRHAEVKSLVVIELDIVIYCKMVFSRNDLSFNA